MKYHRGERRTNKPSPLSPPFNPYRSLHLYCRARRSQASFLHERHTHDYSHNMVTAEAGSGFGNIPPDYSSQNGHADRGKDRGILDLAICADGGDFVSSNTRTQQHSNILDLAVCGDGGDVPSMSKRRRAEKQDGLLEVLRKAMVDHQLGLSLNLLALLALTHVMFPSLRKTTSAFFALSYPTQQDGMYGLGSRDMYLVSFLVVLFTAVRAGTLDYVLIPLAEACGVKTRKAKIR